MRNLTVSLIVAIAVMGGFYAGFRYEKSKVPDSSAGSPVAGLNSAGAPGTGAGRTATGTSPSPGTGGTTTGGGSFAGRGTFGSVVSISGNTLTIKDAQGNDVKVTLQDSTTVTKTVTGSTSDLVAGANVTVAGQRAADGSVTATNITIVPAGSGVAIGRGAPPPSPGG